MDTNQFTLKLRCTSAVYQHAAELAAFGESLLAFSEEDMSLSEIGFKLLDQAREYLEEFHADIDFQLSPEGQKASIGRLQK